MRKKSFVTVTDLFCGAGGSSQGAMDAGAEISMAVNHWRLAVETHASNFPDTDHDCADISHSDPRRYPSTDILIASPECTNHSLAKGKRRKNQGQLDLFENRPPDPSEERSRATMFDVPRFAEYHDYNAIIVENVVDIRHWRLWDAWLHAMQLLGYEYEVLYLNSMFFWPTPQSRDRLYVVFWKHGLPKPDLDYRPAAYCPRCGEDIQAVQSWKNPTRKWGRYGRRNQYVYRCPACAEIVNPYYHPAATAIDWSLLGERIGDRKTPLKPRTMERIRYGLEKFGRQSLTVQLDYTHSDTPRAWPVSRALPTQTARQVMGVLSPFVLEYYSRPNAAGSIDEPLSTIVTENRHALVTPFLISYYGGEGWWTKSFPVGEALRAITTWDHHGLIVPPFLTSVNHSSDRARSVDSPLPTQTSVNAPYLVSPFLFNYYGARPAVRSTDDPLAAVTSWMNHALIQPPAFITEFYGNGKARSVHEALSTLMAQVNHHGLVQMLVSYYGQDTARPVSDPMGTLTTVDRHAMVEAPGVEPEDCYFRMLTPEEVKRGMAFPDEYIVLGNNRERVRQAGNAVTPPAMRWLMKQAMGVFA